MFLIKQKEKYICTINILFNLLQQLFPDGWTTICTSLKFLSPHFFRIGHFQWFYILSAGPVKVVQLQTKLESSIDHYKITGSRVT